MSLYPLHPQNNRKQGAAVQAGSARNTSGSKRPVTIGVKRKTYARAHS
jgi:hypothetical protein